MEDIMALHRSKLETDRQALRQINQARSPIVPSRESLDAMKNAPPPRQRMPENSPPYTGLQLGGYETHQKKLKAQANIEYNKYLQKQNLKSTYQQSPLIEAEKEIKNRSKDVTPRSMEATPRSRDDTPRSKAATSRNPSGEDSYDQSPRQNNENLEEAYQQLLERKRDIERKYRSQLGDYPAKEPASEGRSRKVRFEKDDELSRAVKRLDALSAYDKELDDWNSMRSNLKDRAIKSARDERPEPVLSPSDRSKSMPHEDALPKRRNNVFPDSTQSRQHNRTPNKQRATQPTPTPFEKDIAAPEDRKKKYAEELRRQMEEQRKAKIKAKEDYIGSPSTNNASESASKPKTSPQSDDRVRQRLAVKFDTSSSPEPSSNERTRARPRIPPSPPVLESPGKLPQYPPGGYFQPQGGYMYPPPYMYPNPYMQPNMMQPNMMQQNMMQPNMMQPNMMQPNMMQPNMMQPRMMQPGQAMGPNSDVNNPQYDPYQHYGLERRRSAESRKKETPPTLVHQKRKNVEIIDSPITRIADIGASGEVKNYSGKALDPLEYARDLKRQVDDREKEKARAKQEQEAYDRKIEAEIEEYNPWGRGGGGAPIKDAQGKSVTDRKTMKENAEDPISLHKEQQQQHIPTITASPKPKDAPQNFGRVNEITGTRQEDDPAKLAAKEDYKSYLQQQITERTKEKEKQKEIERLEDEKEYKRIEAERLRLKDEFERELQAKKEKDEAQRKMNEELKNAAEERRHDQEKRAQEAKRKQEDDDARGRAEEKRQQTAQRAPSPAIPTYRPDTRNSVVIPTLANKQSEPARESIVIPSHRSHHKSPVVPKLDLSSQVEIDSGGLRESDRRPPSIVGPTTNADVMQAGDVTKDHVMGQLSALREQLNRLQQVKRGQTQSLKVADGFDTPLERAAKRRQPPPALKPPREDYDNLSILNQDLKDRYGVYSGLDLDDQLKSLHMQDRDSLDAQCSTEFVACTPEPSKENGRRSTENTRYKRPPSATSTVSFDVHKIAERNEERLRRLENMTSGRIFKEESPDMILDAFLENNRPPSELSLDCETTFKADY